MPEKDQTQILPVPSIVEMIEYQTLLGTGKTYDISHLLTCYETALWVMEENKEWKDSKYNEFTQAKFLLLREKVLEQIRATGRFTINAPFPNPCTKCGGAGELFRFIRRPQMVTCMKCSKGIRNEAKCPTCRGKGKLKTFGIIAQMKDTTTCPYCHGKGFFKEKKLDNPLFDRSLAAQAKKKIKTNMIKNEPTTNLGAEIETVDAAPEPDSPMIETDQPPAE